VAAGDRQIPLSEVVISNLSMTYSDWLHYLFRHRWQIVRFVIVGVSTFVLYFLSFHLFFGAGGFGYKTAVSMAYIITVACHFVLNRFFTFNAHRQDFGAHAGRYGLMLILNYGITLAVMWTCVEVAGISPYFGTVASTLATASSSFFVMKHFVFGPNEAHG
jgi:putative flippase GtrA